MEATRTYLELTSPGQFKSAFGQFPNLVLERVARPTPALYRDCYRTVGEAYHWRDRWDWTDDDIRTHLANPERSEEHTSELQSLAYLVCRLLLEKKKYDHSLYLISAYA